MTSTAYQNRGLDLQVDAHSQDIQKNTADGLAIDADAVKNAPQAGPALQAPLHQEVPVVVLLQRKMQTTVDLVYRKPGGVSGQ